MIPELVTVHTSLLTDLGDAVRERFGLTDELTLDEMAAIVEPSIPSAYIEKEWLEAAGNSYIQLGEINADGYDIEFLVDGNNASEDAVFGNRKNYNSAERMGLFYYNATYGFYGWGDSDTYLSLPTFTLTAKHRIQAGIKFGGKVIYDGADAGNLTTTASGGKVTLFNAWENKTNSVISGYGLHGKIYSCKLYNGNNLINDLVPCIRISDSAVGVYDKVTEVFFAGTGTFITP